MVIGMIRSHFPFLAISLLALTATCPAEPALVADESVPGRATVAVPAGGGPVEMAAPFPSIVAAHSPAGACAIELDKDAAKLLLHAPEKAGAVACEIADKSVQLADGTIILSALDAQIHGEKAKLESQPGTHRIGFWTSAADWASWDFKATRWGMYDAELTYSLAAGETEAAFKIAGQELGAKLPATGSWYRYGSAKLGRVYVESAGPLEPEIRIKAMTGGAAMNLKAIILRPAPEGRDVVKPGDGGALELDSSDATVHGVMLRYEPKEEKQCLGFWTNPNDWAEWSVEIPAPGAYAVTLTQGCGKGHGGSEARVLCAGQELTFTVEDTGGFQNWRERPLGEIRFEKAGTYSLAVKPVSKKGVAVMDIRRLRLDPK